MTVIQPEKIQNQRLEEAKGVLDIFLPWAVGGILALISQLAAPAFQRIIEEGRHEKLTYDISYIILFFLFLIWFAQIITINFRARTKEMRVIDDPGHCPILIVFLSTVWQECPCNLTNNGLHSLPADLKKFSDYKKAMNAQNKRPINWAWEMPLRSIDYHIKDINNPLLKEIVVVCSPESLGQFEKFNVILTGYLTNTSIKIRLLLKTKEEVTNLETYSAPTQDLIGIEFEEFDGLSKHLHRGIRQLRKEGQELKNIMIDFTGGQKVTSVVAATLTFNSEINAQYISTKTLGVKGYDIVYGTRRIPKLG